ncbi:ChbG/HpnK family deacetylase [Proteus mirabilis]|nr:ChbG/HpnK family deacetylase [Proteus mirabilis]MBG2925172.1 ChbG/HpnK family deacetylase [Proteus mirabilis]MBI6433760.1 ChbG/HpnK family deacetylase [Proteus mirabilis]MBI6497260.1 ChbG/HpnK family deacetylase [Proteus mirabilis]HEK0601514.1 ChbG/HpnK family deacetylase [Proteus mirabilis]
MEKIIINADDFGLSQTVNRAIIDCFHHNIINSTTILVNMNSTDEAIQLAKDLNLSVGIHLNLVEGCSLTSEIKCFPQIYNNEKNKFDFNIKRFSLKLNKHLSNAIKKELDYQICYLFDNNIYPTHLDSHQHTHTIYPIFNIVKELSKKYNLKVRIPRTTGSNSKLKKFYKKIITLNLISNKINLTNEFINYDEFKNGYNHKGNVEVMVHPDLNTNGDIFCNTTNTILIKNQIL